MPISSYCLNAVIFCIVICAASVEICPVQLRWQLSKGNNICKLYNSISKCTITWNYLCHKGYFSGYILCLNLPEYRELKHVEIYYNPVFSMQDDYSVVLYCMVSFIQNPFTETLIPYKPYESVNNKYWVKWFVSWVTWFDPQHHGVSCPWNYWTPNSTNHVLRQTGQNSLIEQLSGGHLHLLFTLTTRREKTRDTKHTK